MDINFDQDFLRDWTGLGFIACQSSMRDLALGVFSGVRAADPNHSAWVVGAALVQASCDNDLDGARKLMVDQGITENSGDLLARAFLGLFEALGKHASSAERLLRSVIADGSDPEATKLAQSVLDNQVLGG